MKQERRLLDRKSLGERHPALASKWRVDWLIRMRRIPFVRVGRIILFDEIEIEKWISTNAIPAQVMDK